MPNSIVTAPGRVPPAFLEAEISSFPLVSEKSFRECVTYLDPDVANDAKTRALWRACEAQIAEHTSWSVDRLVAVRDQAWFGADSASQPNAAQRVSMARYLRHIARMLFAPSAGITRPAAGYEHVRGEFESRQRWLSFALPEDLLFAGLGVDPAPNRAEPSAPMLLRRLLDLGVVEVHQHLGAGLSFPLLWASALAALATSSVSEQALEGPGAPLDEGKGLVHWMCAAFVARCVLAEFLFEQRLDRDGASPSLGRFLSKRLHGSRPSLAREREQLGAALLGLREAKQHLLPSFPELCDLYADLHPTARDLAHRPVRNLKEAFHRCDPIGLRLGRSEYNAGERWFQRSALLYLEQTSDRLFERLFWQVVRIRCLYYRAIVERPLNSGLQWFVRFYERISKLRGPVEPILIEASFENAGDHRQPIAALEVRTSVKESAAQIADELLTMTQSWQQVLEAYPRAPELGILFHFLKTRDTSRPGAWRRGTPAAYWAQTHSEPRAGEKMRCERQFEAYAKHAEALIQLIKGVPSVLWLVRGLDIAADELGSPTWVYAPLFERVRQFSDIAAYQAEPHAPPPLGVTTHAGEDFRHLLEGLRRVYEHLHYVLGTRGGRLGHAIALGIDPWSWAESAGTVTVPAEERLWDLVMEWRHYTQYRLAPDFAARPPPGRIDRLTKEARELSELVFQSPVGMHDLAALHDTLHTFLLSVLREFESPAQRGADVIERALRRFVTSREPRPGFLRSLEHYLCDEPTFRRGQTLWQVPSDSSEIAALDTVQAALRRGAASRGIVVEVNPSSNLLVGDLSDLRNHPILRLCPPERGESDLPPVAIAVGSDDPVTFSTSLLHEYLLLHQAGLAAGYPERTVLAWLEAIRQTGMDARMTVPWRPSAKARAKQLRRELAAFADRHDP